MGALVVLAGGTLLTSQVQGDLAGGIMEVEGGKPPDTEPLQLNDFKIPQDTPISIPPGAEISPDLSRLTLPEDTSLQLPSDLDLSGLSLELPEDFDLELPEGTVFSPPGLTLPEGATIRLPDGRTLTLPPGSQLDLPPEVVSRLLDEGLPAGALPEDRSFSLRDLPPDLQASLDPPQFAGGGTLQLPGGTTLQLPPGHRFPLAGAVPYALRYLLPAGTSFEVPADDGALPVPRPHSRGQILAPGAGPRTPVETEITTLPARATKGEVFSVSGYVRERDGGRPVPGAPVDIFLNETKGSPGVLLAQTQTDASGTFTASMSFPADKPAREYQLVNHAAAFMTREGRTYADAWGDPPIAAVATTTLQLDVPERDGLGIATPMRGILLDNTGFPVVGVPVVVSVDGAAIGRPVTDANGRFAILHAFPSVGKHEVEARYLGSTSYRASPTEERTITIGRHAIDIASVVRGSPGDALTLGGRLLTDGAPVAGATVSLAGFPGAATSVATTDGAGRFSFALAVPAQERPGVLTLAYAASAQAIAKTQVLEVNETGRLTLSVASSGDAETALPATARLATLDDAGPLAGQLLRFTLVGPGGVSESFATTDTTGAATTELKPLRPMPGNYTLHVRVARNPNLDAPPVSRAVTLSLLEARWELPSTVVRGEQLSGAVTLRYDGRPYAEMPIWVDLHGPMQLRTDANGRAAFTRAIEPGAALGPTAIVARAPDHPDRGASVLVVAMPRIAIQAPAEFASGRRVDTTIELTDDQGEPLRDQTLTLLRDGERIAEVKTDRRGRWSGGLDLAEEPRNVTLTASFAENAPYLAAQQTRVLSAVYAPPPSLAWLFWAVPLVALAAAGAGGAWWMRHRRKPRAALAEAPAVAAAPALALHAADVEARFAIPEDEPAVWGVGEPLALALRNRGRAGEIEIVHDRGAVRMRLAEGGDAATSFTFPDEGEAVVRVRRLGASGMADAEARVRVVDYRKETAREFDLFLAKARALEPSLTRRSTPREIEAALATHLGPRAELDAMALAVEITNYSHHAIERADYLRFVRASRALDPHLAPPAEA